MKINSISAFNYTSKAFPTKPKENYNKNNSLANVSEPRYFRIPNSVLFTGEANTRQRIIDVDFYSYRNLRLGQRQILRKQYNNFENLVNVEELAAPKNPKLPLKSDVAMKHYIDVCKKYTEFKNDPILCLGRSPKWFLSGAYWMRDGLYKKPPYKGGCIFKPLV